MKMRAILKYKNSRNLNVYMMRGGEFELERLLIDLYYSHGSLYAFDSSLSNNRLELSDNIILCYNEEKIEVFKCQKQVISF